MPRLDAETLDMLLGTLREYAADQLKAEVLLGLDRREEFPERALRELYDPARVGVHLLSIPEDLGGIGGGAYDVYRVSEVLAEIDLGVATGVLATFLGTDPIVVGGTDEQKRRWLGAIAEQGWLVAYGATEPQAGSDLAALVTKAEPVAEGGAVTAYRITGRKQWISNGGVAQLYTVLANAPGGPSWFVVERDTPGLTFGKPEEKHGIRSSNTAAVYLDGVVVPADHLVGGVEGRGLIQAQAVFGYTRLMVAAFGLGAGWEALRRAVRYSQQRIQAGAPLSEKTGYTHKLLVPNACRLEAARAYVEWTAERIDAGEGDLATEGAVAKYSATEAANRAAEDAIQALGGYGYTHEYVVEKIKRDVRITTIYEGTSEIMEWTIARDRWQAHLKTKGQHYRDWAARARTLDASAGAQVAAQALDSLAVLLERCRLDRLTRSQHVLFRLGELIAHAETAAVFAERAVAKPSRVLGIEQDVLKAMARVHARDAALRVAGEGLRWAFGAGQTDPDLVARMGLEAAVRAQTGQLEDMETVARGLVRAFPA